MVCGMTAGVADSRILNQSVTFESNLNHTIQIQIEALQVPTKNSVSHWWKGAPLICDPISPKICSVVPCNLCHCL